MNEDLIYCPHCGKPQQFVKVRKRVRNDEFNDIDEEIYVVCCEKCKYPIAAYLI